MEFVIKLLKVYTKLSKTRKGKKSTILYILLTKIEKHLAKKSFCLFWYFGIQTTCLKTFQQLLFRCHFFTEIKSFICHSKQASLNNYYHFCIQKKFQVVFTKTNWLYLEETFLIIARLLLWCFKHWILACVSIHSKHFSKHLPVKKFN